MNTMLQLKKKISACLMVGLLAITSVYGQVSVTSTGGTASASYANLNAFFAAVNAGTHTGVIQASITSNLNEGTAFTPTALNASGQGTASYTRINITTAGTYTVSGSPVTTRSLIELNGADNVTIDGNFGGVRALTFENTAATSITGSAVIRLIGATTAGLGCTNDTIRNCVVIANGDMAATTATTHFGIYAGGTATPTTSGTGDLHTNIIIHNNQVMRATVGIHVAGTTTTGNNATNIQITNNSIGSHATNFYVRWRGVGIGNATNSIVRGNTIFNVRSAIGSSSSGVEIFGTASNNVIVAINDINRVYNLSTGGWAANGVNANGGNNHLIINNAIWDMLGVNYSSFSSFIAAGIRLSSGTGHRVFYNTVHLFSNTSVSATTPTNPISTAFYVSSTVVTGISVRNNIFSNKMTSTFSGFRAFAVLFPSGYNFSTALNTINHNSYNIPATPTTTTSYFVGSLSTAATLYPTLASWRAVTFGDANSVPTVNANVPFANDSTMQLPAGTPSELESGGAVLTGAGLSTPNTDIMGLSRPAFAGTAPDMGAYEFDGIPSDFTPPVISYTDLTNTGSTANRPFTVTITDPSLIGNGVNAPRFYFKKASDPNTFVTNNSAFSGWKYVSTSDTSSPFNFTIDYNLLFGGGVAVNDTIQYFVIAQDRSVNANTSTLPATGFGGGRVDSFTVAPTPKMYIISPPPLAGSYTVGTAGNFSNLSNAIGALNLRGVSAPVTFLLTDTLYSTGETFPLQLNDNIPGLAGTNTVTIKPDANINATIQGASTAGLIKLNGTDNVIIDGSNNNSTSRNLTIINTSATTTAGVIWLASADATNGATRNIIRNCNIRGASPTTTYAGIFIGGTSSIIQTATALAPNHLNIVTNNDIHTLQFGVLNIGAVNAIDSGIVVSNNAIGSATAAINGGGIALYFSKNATVTNNLIQNVRGSTGLTSISGSATTLFGIYIRNNQNTLVRYNTIHTLAGSGSQRNHGIITESPNFATALTPSNNVFADNVLYHIHNTSTGNTAWSLTGIGTYGGFGDRILFNSVQLSHPTGGNVNAAAGPFAAFSNGNAVQTANTPSLEVRNNLFMVRGASVAGATPYVHYTNLTAYNTSTVNHNRYFQNSTGTTASHLGFFNGVARTTFTDWQTATAKDSNTVSGDPIVGSLTNLRPQLNSPLIGAGTPIAGFNIDAINTTRSATAPSIGAYEQGVDLNPPTIQYTTLTNQASTANLTLTNFATITDVSGVVSDGVNKPTLYYKKRSDANAFVGNTAADNGWKYVQATNTTSPFSFTIDYNIINGGFVSVGDTIQYFVVAQDSVIPSNVGSNPGLNFNANNVLSIVTAPSNPNSYIVTQAPLAGNYNIGVGGDFNTIADAVGNLNLRGVSAPVNFLLIDTLYTITAPIEFATYVGMNASNPVVFRPGHTLSTRITGTIADALIRFNGTRFVQWIGYNSLGTPTHQMVIENTSTGGNTVVIRNDASNNVIKYCVVRGANTSATGGVLVINTSVATGNNNNIVENNFITSIAPTTTPYSAVYITGTLGVPNSGNIIRENYISNFTNRGVFVTTNNNNTTITGNHFYQTVSRSVTAAYSAVYIDNNTGSNMFITNNFIGGSDTACGGATPMSVTGAQLLQLIYFSGNNTTAHQITGNRFANMTLTTTNTGANHGLVFLLNGRINCSNNTFGNDTAASSINIVYNGTAQSNFYIIGAGGTLSPNFDTITINNNFMGGITATGTGTGVSLRGIDYAGTNGFFIFENNTIGSPTRVNSISQNTPNSIFGIINRNSNTTFTQRFVGNTISNLTSNTGVLTGVHFLGSNPAIIDNNVVQQLVSNSTTQTGTGINAAVIGMYVGSSGTAQKIIRRNTVKNCYTTAASAIANVGGIVHNNTSTLASVVTENKVSGLFATSSAACTIAGMQHIAGTVTMANNFVSLGTDSVGTHRTQEHNYVGIQKQAGNTTIAFNTVRILGTNVTTNGTVNTFAFQRTTTGIDSVVNNILYTERSNNVASGGSHFAIGINDTTTLTSVNNLLYTSGVNGNVGLFGTTSHQFFSAWQTATNRDLNSVSKSVQFVSYHDLHLTGSSIGDLDLRGVPMLAITRDVDGELRNTTFPYMGADENVGTPLPVSWLYFNGKRNGDDVVLNWATAVERNNKGFYIERKRANEEEFETIGFVPSAVISSNQVNTYTFTDSRVNDEKVLFYRLRQTDLNGALNFSSVIKIQNSNTTESFIKLYPNPMNSEGFIELTTEAGTLNCELVDLSGNVLHKWTIDHVGGTLVTKLEGTDKLATGVFLLKVENNGFIHRIKCIRR